MRRKPRTRRVSCRDFGMTVGLRTDRGVCESSDESSNLCRRSPFWRRARDAHFLDKENGRTGKSESLAPLAQKKTELPDALPGRPTQGYELSPLRKENGALRSRRRGRTRPVFGQGLVRGRGTRETDRKKGRDRNLIPVVDRRSALEIAFMRTRHPQGGVRHDPGEIPVPPGVAGRKWKNRNGGKKEGRVDTEDLTKEKDRLGGLFRVFQKEEIFPVPGFSGEFGFAKSEFFESESARDGTKFRHRRVD